MSTRQVYLNFQDGTGFVNVSDLVKYDTLTYTQRAFNDSYHYAQNECSFDILYDSVIFPKLRYVTEDILVRIVDLKDNAIITTEDDWFITTENSFYICAETDIAVPVFYGHIPASKSRTYDGILENTVMSLSAVDELDWMSTEVGDVVYASCAVLNPLDPANSIVHKLAAIAGWDASRVTMAVNIPTIIDRFAPNDITDTVLEVLDTLLYEYGYALCLGASGKIEPSLWDVPDSQPSTYTFDDENIIDSIQIDDEARSYDSAKIIYYEMGSASKVRLYTDDNCGYNSDGTFTGYAILDTYYYPPEANAIDETTSTNQIVEQEYTDDAITYWTNKAIKENLDYSYKAFSSDFSALIATENHFIDRRLDSGVTIVTETFGNKKCRLLYRNTTGSTKYLYYNNVYGDVWYKTTERTTTVDAVSEPTKQNKYTTSYVFSKASANALAKALAAQYTIGKTLYTFTSEIDRAIGSLVTINTGDGTNQTCIIREKTYDEYNELYTYKCIACSIDRGSLTKQTVSVKISIDTASPFSLSLSTGQLNIPYNGTVPDFTNAYVDISITRDSVDVTQDWVLSAVPSGVSGSFIGNRYKISAITAISASVGFTATRSNWSNLSSSLTVVKAIGEKGDPGDNGTSVIIKGSVDDYTGLPTSGQIIGDLYIVLATGGGYTAGDGAAWNGSAWDNVGQIQGPAGSPGSSSYLHIAYANDASGTNFSTSDPTGRAWIGTYVDSNMADSTNYTSYTWKKYVGDNGSNAVVMTSASTPAGTYVGQMGIWSSRIFQWNGSSWILQSVQPKYLGAVLAGSFPTSYTLGDWYLRVSQTAGDTYRGVFLWDGGSWVRTTGSDYISAALSDILYYVGAVPQTTYPNWGTVENYGATYIYNLFSMYIKILSGGAIYGGTRFLSDGTLNDSNQAGFWLGASGAFKAGGADFTGTVNATGGSFSSNNSTKRVLISDGNVFFQTYTNSSWVTRAILSGFSGGMVVSGYLSASDGLNTAESIYAGRTIGGNGYASTIPTGIYSDGYVSLSNLSTSLSSFHREYNKTYSCDIALNIRSGSPPYVYTPYHVYAYMENFTSRILYVTHITLGSTYGDHATIVINDSSTEIAQWCGGVF